MSDNKTSKIQASCRPVDLLRVHAAAERDNLSYSGFVLKTLLDRAREVLGDEAFEAITADESEPE